MEEIKNKLKNKIFLDIKEAKQLQDSMLKGNLTTEEIIEIFDLIDDRILSEDELKGIVDASRASMNKIEVDFDCLDTAGTGGDGLNTFNISTLSAIVAAACGAKVAKHGNRSASGKCGSADILEMVGVKIDLSPEQAKRCLEEIGIAFLFAPIFHPAFKNVAEARKAYGKKTYFNILGPSLNPARAKYQVIGLFDRSLGSLIGNTLMSSGSKRLFLTTSSEGLDELSIFSENKVLDFSKQGEEELIIDPFKLNLNNGLSLEQIQTKTKEDNHKIFMDIITNKANDAQKNIVILNTTAGLVVCGKAQSFKEGIEIAKEAIESGKAERKLNEFINISNSL